MKRGKSEGWIVALACALVALAFTLPACRNVDHWGIGDWDAFLSYNAVPREAMLHYGQFPLWNPYYCGGMPLLAMPESGFLSPSFLLVLLFGVVRGLKITIWLHVALGLGGMYALARRQEMGPSAASLAAGMLMLSSMFALTLVVGLVWGFAIAYMPWAFLFYLNAATLPAPPVSSIQHPASFLPPLLLCSLTLVLMWFSGGVYPLCISLLLFGVHALTGIGSRRMSLPRTATLFTVLGVVTCGLAAVKLLPAIEFTRQFPRLDDLYCGFSLKALGYSLLGRDQTIGAIKRLPMGMPGFLDGFSHPMQETGMYVGWLPLALFLVGFATCFRRRRLLAIPFILFLWLGFGVRAPLSLWNLLHKLPVFNIMRVAERFRFAYMLIGALFAGWGLETVRGWLQQKAGQKAIWPRWLIRGLVVAVLLDMVCVNSRVWRDAFIIPPWRVERADTSQFAQVRVVLPHDRHGLPVTENSDFLYCAASGHYPAFLSNLGVILGYEDTPTPRAAVPMDAENYQGEVWLQGSRGTAAFTRWTPNRFDIRVQPSGDGWVVVNQNYYSGWQALAGGKVESRNGLLAVRVGPRDESVSLVYRPRSFVIGLWITAISSAAVLAFAGVLYFRSRSGFSEGVLP